MAEFRKGRLFPSERIVTSDTVTGVTLWQITNFPANHSNIYFTKSSFTPDENKIVFVSQRSGWTNLYTSDFASGEITQLTEYEGDIGLSSPCISQNGNWAYYTLGETIRKVNLTTFEEDVIVRFADGYPGHLHLSPDGKFLVTRIHPGDMGIRSSARKISRNPKGSHRGEDESLRIYAIDFIKKSFTRIFRKKRFSVVLVDLKERTSRKLLDTEKPGIALISPDSEHILYHKYERELWIATVDGEKTRCLYNQGGKTWVTHPNWLNREEVLFIEWPHALRSVSLEGAVRTICSLNLRHPSVNREQTSIICDTTHPDQGLTVINPNSGETRVVCYPDCSQQKQWKRSKPPLYLPYFPSMVYDPFGSEWAHAHASFSPKGNKVIFNSDRGAIYPQVYIAFIGK